MIHKSYYAVLAAALLLIPANTQAQGCPDATALTRDLAAPLSDVRYLANDALDGRLAGSAGEKCAGDYIAARFKALGLQPAGEAGTYFQTLSLASVVNPHAALARGRNVIALLPGTNPSELVIIGAHYDHLGLGPFGSMAPADSGSVHNGADDNASGVAAMLRAATLLRDAKPARSILFIAFTGEESGLLGSAWYTKHPTTPITGATAMLNMDMVGRLGDGTLIVNGVDTAEEWRTLLDAAGTKAGIPMAYSGSGYGPSDHTSFYVADIPVLHFFTNTHGDYHKPSDDWQKIDAAGLERVSQLVATIAMTVADRPSKLALVKIAPEPPKAGGAGYGAYLGTIPDFSPVERGVLLGGVTAGSPGDRAGLRKGDVLIRLGGKDVKDLQGFTDVLREHKPGDRVEIVVLRGTQEVKLEAVLGTRS